MKYLWKKYDVSIIACIFVALFIGCTFTFDWITATIELVVFAVFLTVKLIIVERKKKKLLYQIKAVSDELSFETGKAFSRLQIPCAVIEADGLIRWFNDAFKVSFLVDYNTEILNIKELVRKEKIEKLTQACGYRIKIDSRYFAIFSNNIKFEDDDVYLLYFFDETKLRQVEKEYYDSRPSILLTALDNASEVYQLFKESECAEIFSQIDKLLDDWAGRYGGLCRKISNTRAIIIVEERGLQRMITDKFYILEKIRDYKYNGRSAELAISIGIGKEQTFVESNNSAKQALDMSQSRGGDQVSIKHQAEYKFYGGVSAGHEKRNKVKTRLIAKTIAEIINDCDNVLIMGHRFSDFDAFGAAVGVYSIAKHFSKKANIVIDTKTSLAMPLVEKFVESAGKDVLVTPERSFGLVHDNTLLFVVDTHKKDFTECPELVDRVKKVVVIDHHRKSVNFIENTVVFYHMPNSSSASEMLTEIAQYIDSKPVIDSVAALALFSGIMLDTRNFIIRSGVRTFEAAAYLKSRAANTVEVKKLFSNDMDIFRYRNEIIDKAEIYAGNCAVSISELDNKNIRLITSQAADEMLNIEGVKASFVVFKNNNSIGISARSYGEVNVQIIMEYLGGGGHQTMAACQFSDISIDEAIKKLYSSIDKYYDNNSEVK